MTEMQKLREALQNCLGVLDTPIARRKIGISPDAEWLVEARDLAKNNLPLSSVEVRISGWDRGYDITDYIPSGTESGRTKPTRPVLSADAGAHRITDYKMPSIGDRVVWDHDPDPTCKLTGVKGTVMSVSPDSRMPHFHVEPDDWAGARIYATWNSVSPVKEK